MYSFRSAIAAWHAEVHFSQQLPDHHRVVQNEVAVPLVCRIQIICLRPVLWSPHVAQCAWTLRLYNGQTWGQVGQCWRIIDRRSALCYALATGIAGARSPIHCGTCKHITNENDPAQCLFDCTCKPLTPKARTVDPAVGRWLWAWSAETTGLPSEFDLSQQRTNGSH